MNTHFSTIIIYIIGFFAIYILCRIFIKPLKWFIRLMLSCTLGIIAMLILNKIFSTTGFFIAINPLTAMMSGVLGLPGIILSYVLSVIL